MYLTEQILRLLGILSNKLKVRLLILLLINIFSTLSDMLSLALILPFVDLIIKRKLPNKIISLFDPAFYAQLKDSNSLMLFIVIVFIGSTVLASSLKLVTIWFNQRIAAQVGIEIGSYALHKVLGQTFVWHKKQNSSSLLSLLSIEVERVTSIVGYLLQLLTFTLTSVGIVLTLIVVDAGVAMASALVLLSIYILSGNSVKRIVTNNSKVIVNNQAAVVTVLDDSLASINDILLTQSGIYFHDKYNYSNCIVRLKQADNSFLGMFPKFFIESAGYISLAVLAFITSSSSSSNDLTLGLLGTYAIGIQKLLPSFQQVYANYIAIISNLGSLSRVNELIFGGNKSPASVNQLPVNNIVDFSIVNQIILSQISFSYKPESGLSDLKNIDLTINRGDRVGIVGLSGSGKSTLLYILMGLLKIGKGSLMVNNHDLHGTSLDAALMKYHMSIGYVPQEVHIVNGSFVDNIAFGVNNSEVDISRVKYCSSIAQLDGFIESLPGQYDYYLGKNGSRLSGGQKQRVGIARALYRNPSVLFFDECTSSLDLMTESDVMSALAELSSDITMVFIAHKVNTLSICNKVFELVNGSLRVVENPAFSGRV